MLDFFGNSEDKLRVIVSCKRRVIIDEIGNDREFREDFLAKRMAELTSDKSDSFVDSTSD